MTVEKKVLKSSKNITKKKFDTDQLNKVSQKKKVSRTHVGGVITHQTK